jgi:hypothetical protein
MSTTITANTKLVVQDVTLLSVSSVTSATGSVGAVQSILGYWKSANIVLKREMIDTTAASDSGVSMRAARWGRGEFEAEGFMLSSGTSLADIFAAGSFGLVQCSLSNGGPQLQFEISMHELKIGLAEHGVSGSVQADIIGVPQYATPGGNLIALAL